MRKGLSSGWLRASISSLIAAFSRDEKFDPRGRDQHLPDFVLEHTIGVGHTLAQMHELEPRFDEIGLLIPPEVARVLEDSPRERAIAPALESELVQRAHKR